MLDTGHSDWVKMSATSTIGIRCSPELKEELEALACALRTTLSGMTIAVLEELLEAHRRHGDRLAWPPKYAYHETRAINPYQIAADHLPEYETRNGQGGVGGKKKAG